MPEVNGEEYLWLKATGSFPRAMKLKVMLLLLKISKRYREPSKYCCQREWDMGTPRMKESGIHDNIPIFTRGGNNSFQRIPENPFRGSAMDYIEPLASRKESPSTLMSALFSSLMQEHVQWKRGYVRQSINTYSHVHCFSFNTSWALPFIGTFLGSEDTKMNKYVPDIKLLRGYCRDKSGLFRYRSELWTCILGGSQIAKPGWWEKTRKKLGRGVEVEKPRKLRTKSSATGQTDIAWDVPRMVIVVNRMGNPKWFASL